MDRRIRWDEITPELIREWAYDGDAILLEQDEDLLLYDVEFIPVLLELIADERCPKRGYVFGILCQFCRELVTRGGEQGTAALRAAWSAVAEPAGGRAQEWHRYVGRLLGYTRPSGPVDESTARRMAEELLLGIRGRVGEVTQSSSAQLGWWRFTLRTSVIEHIDVCAATGAFSYVPYY